MTVLAVKSSRLSRRVAGIARVGGAVRERARFVTRELAQRGGGTYTLRDGGLRVCVRHGSEDAWILGEVFIKRLYELPEPARAALAEAGEELRVLDLGGHVGTFGLWALIRYPQASVRSVEADPDNARALRATIAANPGSRWEAEEAVAAAAAGTVAFRAGGGSGSRIVAAGEGNVERPAIDVVPDVVAADLVKIDIEGGEWPILADPRLASARARALVLEVHPHGAPEADFAGAAHARLRELGYATAAIEGAPEAAAMLWAWRA